MDRSKRKRRCSKGLQFDAKPAGTRRLNFAIPLELRAGLPVEEVDRRVARAARAGDVGARVIAFYMADLAARGAHQLMGYRRVLDYAIRRYHIRPSTAREYLRVGRALEHLPLIDAAVCEGRLSWSQVRSLVRIAVPETEAEWVTWAARHTVRQLAAQIRYRDKGDRPADPARRRIHTTRFKVQGTFNVVQMEMWNQARAKLQGEMGEALSDTEMMMELLQMAMTSRPDGTVPGRTPVNDSMFKVVVQVPGEAAIAAVRTADGLVNLDHDTAAAVMRAAGFKGFAIGPTPNGKPAGSSGNGHASGNGNGNGSGSNAEPQDAGPDDAHENAGPPVPREQRDKPTPPALRQAILARDGYRCLCCGGTKNLTVHHKQWRENGGRTTAENELTECDDCHPLIHDDLLVIRGRIPDQLRFTDANGRSLDEYGVPAGGPLQPFRTGDARASRGDWLDGRGLPADVDHDWWRRHAHLLPWNGTQGSLELRPGLPAPPAPPKPAAGTGDARASLPDSLTRPGLASLVGQQRVVKLLMRVTEAARSRGGPAPHILLYGPPGLGKTTMAGGVAAEMGAGLHVVSAPVVKDPAVLLDYLTSLRENDVLLIDELHRLPDRVAETLYEAMEHGRLSLPVRCGEHERRTLHVHLAPFTLVGATTADDKLLPPLVGRFRIRQRLAPYDPRELAELLRRGAKALSLRITADAASRLAGLSRGTPREALALLAAARDEAQLAGRKRIDATLAERAVDQLGYDGDGLLPLEREYLKVLRESAGPVGLATLAARLDVPKQTLRRIHEPYLLRRGLVALSRRGRMLR